MGECEQDQCISQRQLTHALKQLLGPEITQHEINTVARHFAVPRRKMEFDLHTLRYNFSDPNMRRNFQISS